MNAEEIIKLKKKALYSSIKSPEFFGKFKKQLFSTIQFPVPNEYRLPKGFTLSDYQNHCLEKIEKRFSKNNDIAAFIMESGAQMAGGVIIYPKNFEEIESFLKDNTTALNLIVNIRNLQIKILDKFGSTINLNNMDFSLTLELELLYEGFNFKNIVLYK